MNESFKIFKNRIITVLKIDKELPIIDEKNLNKEKYQIVYIKDIINIGDKDSWTKNNTILHNRNYRKYKL